jgi:glycosyltransferase involved in cell wall biosynthesis
VVRTEHLPDVITDSAERASHTRMLESVDRLICVSSGSHASFLEAGVAPEKLCTIRNGILPRPTGMSRGEARRALGLSHDIPLVLTVARFTEQKGHHSLLQAIPSVLACCPRTCFLWVGQGPLESELRAEVSTRGLASRVRFLGHRDDVPSLMAAADLFVLPSAFEGLPLVLLEAMATGLPVIATRVSGTREAVDDGATGLLVQPGDDAGLAAAIVAALMRPDLTVRWAAAGKQSARVGFSAARMAHETAGLYDDLLLANAKRSPRWTHPEASAAYR